MYNVVEEATEWACPAFKGRLVHELRGLHSHAYVSHVTMLHIDHIGCKDHGCLCKLPESLMAHAQP